MRLQNTQTGSNPILGINELPVNSFMTPGGKPISNDLGPLINKKYHEAIAKLGVGSD